MIYKTFALVFIFARASATVKSFDKPAVKDGYLKSFAKGCKGAGYGVINWIRGEDAQQNQNQKDMIRIVTEKTKHVDELRKKLKNGRFEYVFENIKMIQPKFYHPCMVTCDKSLYGEGILDSKPSCDVVINFPKTKEDYRLRFNKCRMKLLVEKLEYEKYDDVYHLLTQAQPYFSLECMKTCKDYNPMPEMENWMKTIDPETHIYDLKIPGTHDTATFALDGSTLVGIIEIPVSERRGVTQILSVKQQLNRGVRWFDARVDDFQNGCKVGMGHYLMSANYCFETMLQELNDFLKAHPSEIVFLKIAYTRKTTGTLYRDVYEKVLCLILEYEQKLCLNTFTKLKDFHETDRRLCLHSQIGYFTDEVYLFPDNNLFKDSKFAPDYFEKKAHKPKEKMTRTQLNTISSKATPIHSRDLRLYSKKKSNEWFKNNVKELNIVSMDFYEEKRPFIEQMMEENKRYQKREIESFASHKVRKPQLSFRSSRPNRATTNTTFLAIFSTLFINFTD
jgi:hypothetical protein